MEMVREAIGVGVKGAERRGEKAGGRHAAG